MIVSFSKIFVSRNRFYCDLKIAKEFIHLILGFVYFCRHMFRMAADKIVKFDGKEWVSFVCKCIIIVLPNVVFLESVFLKLGGAVCRNFS